jgi:DNA-binding CsgD family transcriptional regulator
MARAGDSAAHATDFAGVRSPDRATDEAPRQRGRRRQRPRSSRLSAKELEVLAELARGFTTEEIALKMTVSPHTVRTHVKNGMRKLDAKTRANAVAIAMADGVIEFPG